MKLQNYFLILLLTFSLQAIGQMPVQLDFSKIDSENPCELVLIPGAKFDIRKLDNHSVYTIDVGQKFDPFLYLELKRQINEGKIPLSERARQLGFVDFYFDGFPGTNIEARIQAGTRLPLKKYISEELYSALANFILPRYRAGYSIVPHAEIEKNRALSLRLYVSAQSGQGRWHRDGSVRTSFYTDESGERRQRQFISQRGWTFGHTFDQADTEFKEIPGFKSSFDTSVIFDAASEEHRASSQNGRLVVLGSYYGS